MIKRANVRQYSDVAKYFVRKFWLYNELNGLKQCIFTELDSPHPLPPPQGGEYLIGEFYKFTVKR